MFLPRRSMPEPLTAVTVPTLVRRAALRDPEKIALWYPVRRGYESLSYRALQNRIERVAGALAARGVGRGDRVVMLTPMRPELYITLLAVMSVGAVAVFVEPKSRIPELARVIRFVEPRAFIGVPKAHALRLAFPEIGRVPVQIVVGRPLPGLRATSLRELERAAPLRAEVEADTNDPAILTFSSGTGGEPKGAVRSHAFLLAQHRTIVEMLGRDARTADVDLTAFAIGALSCFASGATAVIPRMGSRGVDDIDGDEIVDLIASKGVTTLSGAPAFLGAVFAAGRKRGVAFPTVRRATTGGAPVSVALCEQAAELLPAAEFSVVYGSTEAEPIAVISGPELAERCLDATRTGAGLCVGRVHRDVTLRLLKCTDEPIEPGPGGLDSLAVAPGEVGEVVVSGPHVNRHYYRNPDAERLTKIREADGTVWHRTGDTAYMDGDERLWIVGRKADTAQASGGRVMHPASVEAVAQTVELVARAALVVDDDGAARLVIEPRKRRDLLRWYASRAVRRRTTARVVEALERSDIRIDRVHLVPRVPVDSRHRSKIDYRRVRRMLPVLP